MKDELELVFNNAGFHMLYSKSTTQIFCSSEVKTSGFEPGFVFFESDMAAEWEV